MGNNSSKGRIIITFIMKLLDDKFNINLYKKLVKEFGDDYRSLNWGSKSSQKKRFKVLNKIGIENDNTVLDFGCGIGDFLDWSIRHNLKLNYTGIDITPDMIKLAKSKFPEQNFICQNIFEQGLSTRYDFILASGAFTYMNYEFFKKCIDILFKNAKIGVGFNLLNKREIKEDSTNMEFSMEPLETIEFCMNYTNKLIIDLSYHKNDFTIFMYKQ